jgi:flavodoxin
METLYSQFFLFGSMKACVLYFSMTGNTRRFAEAISDALEIPVFDVNDTEPSAVNGFDTLILGTPVHGFNPSKEILSFADRLPDGNGKRTMLFCTCRLWKGRTFGKLKKELKKKNYKTILSVSKRGRELTKENFSDAVAEIAEALT